MVKTVYDPNWAVKWGQNHYKIVNKSYNSIRLRIFFSSDDHIWVKSETDKKTTKL